ncbi:hypothetical protein [Amycolatopsis thailandensis]|uniref:hypothetical protein n=1 Tax=Amycolatopsis thailandensis TaxID=589330 RepID=UPI00117747EE|nr:hypothetical protein [Amycolatopsis thailandensis]
MAADLTPEQRKVWLGADGVAGRTVCGTAAPGRIPAHDIISAAGNDNQTTNLAWLGLSVNPARA